MAYLLNKANARIYNLTKNITILGNSLNCDIFIEAAGFPVSRQHAFVAKRRYDFYLGDVSSTMGTSISFKRFLDYYEPIAPRKAIDAHCFIQVLNADYGGVDAEREFYKQEKERFDKDKIKRDYFFKFFIKSPGNLEKLIDEGMVFRLSHRDIIHIPPFNLIFHDNLTTRIRKLFKRNI